MCTVIYFVIEGQWNTRKIETISPLNVIKNKLGMETNFVNNRKSCSLVHVSSLIYQNVSAGFRQRRKMKT